jgi:hypothetical protein
MSSSSSEDSCRESMAPLSAPALLAWRSRGRGVALFRLSVYALLARPHPRTDAAIGFWAGAVVPGRWMAHCHIAEPHESGMMFSFDVAALCQTVCGSGTFASGGGVLAGRGP